SVARSRFWRNRPHAQRINEACILLGAVLALGMFVFILYDTYVVLGLPPPGCRARRSVAPQRRAQGARSQAECTGAAQGRVEKRGRLRPSRRRYYDHVEGEE